MLHKLSEAVPNLVHSRRHPYASKPEGLEEPCTFNAVCLTDWPVMASKRTGWTEPGGLSSRASGKGGCAAGCFARKMFRTVCHSSPSVTQSSIRSVPMRVPASPRERIASCTLPWVTRRLKESASSVGCFSLACVDLWSI